MEQVSRAANGSATAGRAADVAAATVVLLSVAATVTAAILDAQVDGAHRATMALDPGWIAATPGLALAMPGALLLRRMPRHPVAWILCLTGLHWTIDGAAASWLAYATEQDPARAGAALVRRLVHDLRPPALDDVGLLAAVRQQAERLRTPDLLVRVEGGPGLDRLPAAVEVAAYRIASEALTNVAKHARASTCRVGLDVAGSELVVEVVDDGVGIPPGTPTGVGLVSVRERAAELGGRCEIGCPGARGTVVRAHLPLGDG